MKTKIIIVAIILSFFACDNQTSLNKEEKTKLTEEIELILSSMRDGMRELNAENAFSIYLDSAEFKFIGVHGEIMFYQEFTDAVKKAFNAANSAEFNFNNYDIRFLSREFALITFQYNGTFYFEEFKMDFPEYCSVSMVMAKKNTNWRIIHMHESLQESTFIKSRID